MLGEYLVVFISGGVGMSGAKRIVGGRKGLLANTVDQYGLRDEASLLDAINRNIDAAERIDLDFVAYLLRMARFELATQCNARMKVKRSS